MKRKEKCFPATCALREGVQREVKYFSASCACVGECNEVRFKGTDAAHRDTEKGVQRSPVQGTGRCCAYEIRERTISTSHHKTAGISLTPPPHYNLIISSVKRWQHRGGMWGLPLPLSLMPKRPNSLTRHHSSIVESYFHPEVDHHISSGPLIAPYLDIDKH